MTDWSHPPPGFRVCDSRLSVRGPHHVTTGTQSWWKSGDLGFSSGSFTALCKSCPLSLWASLSSEGLGSDNSEVLGFPTSYDQVESFRDLISLPPTLC